MFKGLGAMGDMAKLMKNAQEMQGKWCRCRKKCTTLWLWAKQGQDW